jgi:hypothetical protein
VKDCQWLQQLHSYGLLTRSFRPQIEIIALQRYLGIARLWCRKRGPVYNASGRR